SDNATLSELYTTAPKLAGLSGSDVGRGRAHREGERAGLDHEAHVLVEEGQPAGMDGEADPAGLPGLEADPREADQLAEGSGHRGQIVGDVELHHLLTGALSGVGDEDR